VPKLKDLIHKKEFMDDLSSSIRNIILATFPHLTPAERQDVDQEVKLKLWRMISNGKDIANLRSYLWRVVYTTTLDLLNERMPCDEREAQRPEEERRPLVSALDNDPPEPETPESIAQKNEERTVVRGAIEALPLKRRIVVKMHFEGKSIEQTAEFLAWSQNKVRHLLYRGLNDLKKRLKNQGEAVARSAAGFRKKLD
jgi:RNA polymerase sigma-70 factor, ECF subfamily